MGRICVVTGANAGIGKAAARQLADRGLTVVMACRNVERGEQARAEVARHGSGTRVSLMSLDTSSLASVRAFAQAFVQRFDRLDVLIHNAGTFDLTQKNAVITADGFESVFATNYLGPWLLTRLLLPLLQASGAGRVIHVGSKGLLAYPFLRLDLHDGKRTKRFSPQRAYYHSKLAVLVHTLELARRLQDRKVVSNIIRVPAVQVDVDRLPAGLPRWQRWMYQQKRARALPPEQMAKTYTALACDEEWALRNGQRVNEQARPVTVPPHARDRQVAAALWEQSAAWVGEEADF